MLSAVTLRLRFLVPAALAFPLLFAADVPVDRVASEPSLLEPSVVSLELTHKGAKRRDVSGDMFNRLRRSSTKA